MLQNIGDKLKGTGEGGGRGHRWFWYLILGVLVIVFAAWGAYGVVDLSFGQRSYAAKVNGEEIPLEEVNDQWQRQLPQLMAAYGGEIPPEQRRELQQQLLGAAVRERATTQYARKLGYAVSRAQLAKAFREEEAFQVDGKFSIVEARARLLNEGISEQAYRADLEQRELTNHILGTVGASDFLTPAEAKRLLALLDEEREVRWFVLDPERFAGSAPVTPEAVETYYREHPRDFAIPESVRLAYAELALADVAARVTVSEEELKARYEQDKAQYVQPETRNARHILIAVEDAAQDVEKAAQARRIHEQLAGGADFAALAREHSADSASARSGGELGWSSRDAYVQAFADKLFSMQVGETSEPVKTEFGYHIIKLEGIRPAAGREFAAVRDDIATQVRNEKGIALFNAEQDRLQGELENASTGFDALVREFGMRRGLVDNFERGAGGLPLGSDETLNREVFSDAVLGQRRVGGPVQLSEDRITIFSVEEHRPAATRPLEEVRADIVATLVRERGAAAALAAGQAAVADLAAGRSMDGVAGRHGVKAEAARFVARAAPDVPVELRDALFAAARPTPANPVRQALRLEDDTVVVFEATNTRTPAMMDMPQLVTLRTQRELERYRRREINAYIESVVRSAKIRENPQAFEQ